MLTTTIMSGQIKLSQIAPCRDSLGVVQDSCCTLTLAGGVLKYLTKEQCKMVYGTNITVRTSDSTILVNGIPLDNFCLAVKKCETPTTLEWDAVNEWYTYTNEKGVEYYLGYKLLCENDSTISITDINNNIVSTCVIRGGVNPEAPVAIEDITVEADSTLLIHFTDGGTAPLDICNVVKKCESVTYIDWDPASSMYIYTNEKGEKDSINYRLDPSRVSSTGYIYFQGNGSDLDSFNLCNPNCPPIPITTSDDSYTTNNCMLDYCSDVSVNDVLCETGVSTYSLITGTNTNGDVYIDASGDFCFHFTVCDASLNYTFMYQAQCKDGTISTSTVTIDLQDACGSALAEQDNTQIPKNGTVSLNLALNDTQCGASSVTMWKKKTNPNHGTIVVNMDGTSIITAMANYVGSDSCIYELWCNNQLCDTAFIKWNVWEASATDNYYNPLAGVPFPFNATADDVACTPPLVTSYAWSGSIVPISAGTVSGTPTSGTFTSAAGFCGTASRPYAELCDADTVSRARVYWNVICALAVNDEFSTQGDTVNANVSTNDIACTNGGITTYHLVSNPTAHGYGLNIPIYQCSGDCPSGTTIVAHLTHWDTLTGAFTLDTTTYSKDMCFRYFIRCKNTVPQMATMDTGCVKILSQLPISQDSILITMPNNTIPSFTVRIGAWCDKYDGTKKALDNGDLLNLTIEPIGISVDLIVGQNICTPSGYANDAGGRWANWVVPSITSCPVTLSASNLLSSAVTFDIRKDSLAKRSDRWGDGTITSTKIGTELYLYLINSNCVTSEKNMDTIPKLYEVFEAYASLGQACYGGASCGCGGVSSYMNIYTDGAWMTRQMGVVYADLQAATTNAQVKCANSSYANTTDFSTTNFGVFNNYYYGLEQACLVCNPVATFDDSVQIRYVLNNIPKLSNVTLEDTIYNSSILKYSGGSFLVKPLSTIVEMPGFIAMSDLRSNVIKRRTWGLNLYNNSAMDSVRINISNSAGGNPLTGHTQLIVPFPYSLPGVYYDPSGTNTQLDAEGKYWKYARATDTGIGTTKYSKSLSVLFSY